MSCSVIICIVCHTVKPDFVASVEHKRLQARRHRDATPERDARVDDLRQRAQARRHREATPERNARLDDQRRRMQARRHREATPERDERLDAQRRRTEARRCREITPVREIRQEQERVRYHASREIDHSAPLFGQHAVHQKMRAFQMQPTRAQSRRLFIRLSKISPVLYITFSLCLGSPTYYYSGWEVFVGRIKGGPQGALFMHYNSKLQLQPSFAAKLCRPITECGMGKGMQQ